MFNILSKNKTALWAVVAAAVLVIFAASAVLIAADRNRSSVVVSAPSNRPISLREMGDRLRLLLFEHNIPKSNFSIKLDGSRNRITIVTDREGGETLRRAVLALFKGNGFSVEELAGQIFAYNATEFVTIAFVQVEHGEGRVEGAEGQTPPPAATVSPPQTVAPAAPPSRSAYPAQITKGSAKIALIIDDAGNSMPLAERLTSLSAPFTMAIIPYTAYAKQTADLSRTRGKTVFLHFPMQPESYPESNPGKGAVLVNMSEREIEDITRANVENLGGIDGANNHMGSAVTAHETTIRRALVALSRYTDTFIDSNTSSSSVALNVCWELYLKCGLNKKFLDNENDHAYIAGKLYEAAALAKNAAGTPVIAIGHLRPDTVAVLEREIPRLEGLGYEFVAIEEAAVRK